MIYADRFCLKISIRPETKSMIIIYGILNKYKTIPPPLNTSGNIDSNNNNRTVVILKIMTIFPNYPKTF